MSPIIGVAARQITKSAVKGLKKQGKQIGGSISDVFSSRTAGISSIMEAGSRAKGGMETAIKEIKKEGEKNKRQNARDKKEDAKTKAEFLAQSQESNSLLGRILDTLKKTFKQDRELADNNGDNGDDKKGFFSTPLGKTILGVLGVASAGGVAASMISRGGGRRTYSRAGHRTSYLAMSTPQVGNKSVTASTENSGAEIVRSKTQLVADIKLQDANIKSQKILQKIEKSNNTIARSTRYLSSQKQFQVRRVKRKRPEEMTTSEYVKSAENQTSLNLDRITEGVVKGILSDKVLDFYGGRRGVTERQASRRGYAGQELGEILDLREGSTKLGEKLFGKKYGKRYAQEFNKLGQVYLQAFTERTADAVFSSFGGTQEENRTLLSQVVGNYAGGNKKLAKEQLIYKFTGIPTGLESLSQTFGFTGTGNAVDFLADQAGSIVGDISRNVLGVDLFGMGKQAKVTANKPDGDLTHVKSIKGAMMVHVVNGQQQPIRSGDGNFVKSVMNTSSDYGSFIRTPMFNNTQIKAREGIKQKSRDFEQQQQTQNLENIESTSQSNTKAIVETQAKGTFALLDGLRNLGRNIFHSIASMTSRMGGGGGGGFNIPGMFDTGNMFMNAATQIGSAYAINYATKGIKDPALRAAAQIGGQLAFNKYVLPKIFNSAAGSSFMSSFGSQGFTKGFTTGIQGGSSFVGASTSYNVGVTAGKVAPYADAIIKLAQGDVKSAAFSAMGTKIGLVVSGGNPIGAVIGTVIGNFVGSLVGKPKKPKPHIRSDYAIVLEGNNNPDAAQEVFTHNRMNLYNPEMVQNVSDLARRLTIAAFNAAKIIEANTGQKSVGTHIYIMVDEITFKKRGAVQIKFLQEPEYKGERRLVQGALGTPDSSKMEFGVTDRITEKTLPYYAAKIVEFVKQAYKKNLTVDEQSKVEKAIQDNLRRVNTETLTTGLVSSLTSGETRLNPNLSKGIYGKTADVDTHMQSMVETLNANRPKEDSMGRKMVFSMKDNKYVEAPFTFKTSNQGHLGQTVTTKVYNGSLIGIDSQGNEIHNAEGGYVFAKNESGTHGTRRTASVIDLSDMIRHNEINPLVTDVVSGDQSFLSPNESAPVNVVTDNSSQTNQPITIVNNNITSYDAIRFSDVNG
tara:strand:- start:20712 stop:24104 length:3393 start_codon:yes stop_codon:yes gene_type:complete